MADIDYNAISDAEIATGASIRGTTGTKFRDNPESKFTLSASAYAAGAFNETAWRGIDDDVGLVYDFSADGGLTSVTWDVDDGYDFRVIGVGVVASGGDGSIELEGYNGSWVDISVLRVGGAVASWQGTMDVIRIADDIAISRGMISETLVDPVYTENVRTTAPYSQMRIKSTLALTAGKIYAMKRATYAGRI